MVILIVAFRQGCRAHCDRGKVIRMFFLLRAAFWLSLVVLLLPAGAPSDATVRQISAAETFGAAQTVVSDVSGFCTRNPQTCEAGGAALQQFGAKAQYGVTLLHGYLGKLTGNEAQLHDSNAQQVATKHPPADPARPGAVQAFTQNGLAIPMPSDVALQTGTIGDLIIEAAGNGE